MKKLDKILALIDRFEGLIKRAQVTTAQSGDIETVLKSANLFNIAPTVSPLLDKAKVPTETQILINIIVDKNLVPKYSVVLNPPNSAGHTLEILLKQQFGSQMRAAFIAAKLNVTNPIVTKWLSF